MITPIYIHIYIYIHIGTVYDMFWLLYMLMVLYTSIVYYIIVFNIFHVVLLLLLLLSNIHIYIYISFYIILYYWLYVWLKPFPSFLWTPQSISHQCFSQCLPKEKLSTRFWSHLRLPGVRPAAADGAPVESELLLYVLLVWHGEHKTNILQRHYLIERWWQTSRGTTSMHRPFLLPCRKTKTAASMPKLQCFLDWASATVQSTRLFLSDQHVWVTFECYSLSKPVRPIQLMSQCCAQAEAKICKAQFLWAKKISSDSGASREGRRKYRLCWAATVWRTFIWGPFASLVSQVGVSRIPQS